MMPSLLNIGVFEMGMSLAEHLNLFYSLIGQPSTNKYSIALVKTLLDRAEEYVNKSSRTIYDSAIFDSEDDTARYDISENLVNSSDIENLLLSLIDDIYYSTTDSTQRKRLEPTSEEELDIDAPTWRYDTRNGNPKKWAIDEESNEIILDPHEKTVSDGENCIEVKYRAKHTKMTRYYATGTLAITKGTPNVVGTDTVFVGNIYAGDRIGIGKLLDPLKATDFPVDWYTVLTTPTSNTALTLSSNFAQTTITESNFICLAPSSIENESLNTASVYMAMSLAMTKGKEAELRREFKNTCNEIIAIEKGNIVDTADYNKPIAIEFRSV